MDVARENANGLFPLSPFRAVAPGCDWSLGGTHSPNVRTFARPFFNYHAHHTRVVVHGVYETPCMRMRKARGRSRRIFHHVRSFHTYCTALSRRLCAHRRAVVSGFSTSIFEVFARRRRARDDAASRDATRTRDRTAPPPSSCRRVRRRACARTRASRGARAWARTRLGVDRRALGRAQRARTRRCAAVRPRQARGPFGLVRTEGS